MQADPCAAAANGIEHPGHATTTKRVAEQAEREQLSAALRELENLRARGRRSRPSP